MEWIRSIWNTLLAVGDTIFTNSENIKNIAEVFAAIIGGVCAIKGIYWLKGLRDKKIAATFGFWSQLAIKLKMLKKRLESNHNLINNLYSIEAKKSWLNISAPPEKESLNEFKGLVEEILSFIKDAPDQMPAYRGWTDDYSKLVDFLDDILYYDVSIPNAMFKFDDPCSVEDRDKHLDDICKILSHLIEEIEKAQKSIEKELCVRECNLVLRLKKRFKQKQTKSMKAQ